MLVVGTGRIERRHSETACNYAEYRLIPGVYPVQLVDLNYQPWEGDHYALAEVPATKFHDYFVNRLLQHTSVDESWDESPATVSITCYVYQLDSCAVTEIPADMTGRAVYIRRTDLPADHLLPSASTAVDNLQPTA
ncbi:hypothetical protein [Nocardia tengchongensis]|uniref:hypothetical protein n=1 Tax=Nocardia tengchongensis TaxID=2055889 RepID=UPI00365D4533